MGFLFLVQVFHALHQVIPNQSLLGFWAEGSINYAHKLSNRSVPPLQMVNFLMFSNYWFIVNFVAVVFWRALKLQHLHFKAKIADY